MKSYSRMAKKRDNVIDVAKGICIFLVVLSHTPFKYSFLFTYWYVQVFFFLSGIFLKKNTSVKEELYKKVKGLLYPYLFFATICSFLCFAMGRVNIDDWHIYDPDSFDNGPEWFLITLFTLNMLVLAINNIPVKVIRYFVFVALFVAGYELGTRQYDDYSSWVKASFCLPFFVSGQLYRRIGDERRILIFCTLFLLGLFGAFTYQHFCGNVIGIRWEVLPNNPIWFLAESASGICLILGGGYFLNKISFAQRAISYVGRNSLFVLCLHWPIIRLLFDHFKIDLWMWQILIVLAICYVTAVAGEFLKRLFPSVF